MGGVDMKGSEAVFGYEVSYISDEDSFTTAQVHRPVDGRFYRVNVVRPVVFEAEQGWVIDASDPYVPIAVGPQGQRVPLNKAMGQGHVMMVPKWERESAPETQVQEQASA